MASTLRIQSIESATGKSWPEWLQFMDQIGAKNLDHRTIAAKAFEVLDGRIDKNAGWWAQAITVTYEQEIGRRVPGQQSDGTFQSSLSKSTGLSMVALLERWSDFAEHDETILQTTTGQPRISGTNNRQTWRVKDKDGSSVMVMSQPKPNGSASLTIQLSNLATLNLSHQKRKLWAAVLQRFMAELGQ